MAFVADACREAGIPFYILYTHLYDDYMNNFGQKYVKSMPFWTLSKEGKKGRWPRSCTITHKIVKMQNFVKYELLGYKYRGRIKKENRGRQRMHIGFSFEEKNRCKPSSHPLFAKVYPLVDMKLVRADNYAYCLDVWGLATKASACAVCPFHKNYFFEFIRRNEKPLYKDIVRFDDMLEERLSNTNMESKIFLSHSHKRIRHLTCEDCKDAQTFLYNGQEVWNGF